MWLTPKESIDKRLEEELPTECLKSKAAWLHGDKRIFTVKENVCISGMDQIWNLQMGSG